MYIRGVACQTHIRSPGQNNLTTGKTLSERDRTSTIPLVDESFYPAGRSSPGGFSTPSTDDAAAP